MVKVGPQIIDNLTERGMAVGMTRTNGPIICPLKEGLLLLDGYGILTLLLGPKFCFFYTHVVPLLWDNICFTPWTCLPQAGI